MFNLYNTEGYTQAECDALNQEFETRFTAGEFGGDRDQAEKNFSDRVARRTPTTQEFETR